MLYLFSHLWRLLVFNKEVQPANTFYLLPPFLLNHHQAIQLQKTLVQFSHSALVLDISLCLGKPQSFPGAVHGVDGPAVPVQLITNYLNGQNCPSLQGKPKLFFIQACGGGGHLRIFHKSCSQKMWSHLLSLESFHVQNPVISIWLRNIVSRSKHLCVSYENTIPTAIYEHFLFISHI